MALFIVYILKSSFCLALFYIFYRLLLSNETFHRFNRTVLLILLPLSCLLPLVEVSLDQSTEVGNTMLTLEQWLMQAEGMADVELMEENVSSSHIWIGIILLVYVAGFLFFVCCQIYLLFRLLSQLNNGRQQIVQTSDDGRQQVVMIVHKKDIAPFSWMKYVVISEKDLEENGKEIMAHEIAHIQQRHSWDLLLVNACLFFQWFNPALWLLKQELQNIHEYEADEAVIKQGVDAKQYQLLLIKKAVGTRLYSMSNSFNHSKLKKRITMMLKEKSSPWATLKFLYVLPVAAIAVSAFARPAVSETIAEIADAKVNELATIVEAKVVKSIENEVKPISLLADTLKPDNGKKQKPERKKQPAQVKALPANQQSAKATTADDDVVFEIVESIPEYPGGLQECMKFLATNMKYPAAAQAAKIEGRVIVQFIVDKEGNVTKPIVIRSVNPELDAEALRVIKTMPKWTPGTQRGKAVNVKFTLPLTFKLTDGKATSETKNADVTSKLKDKFGATPLIIVDGQEVSADIFSAINNDKIDAMQIWKDEKAIEKYGEKGKNGVVVVTLKKAQQPE